MTDVEIYPPGVLFDVFMGFNVIERSKSQAHGDMGRRICLAKGS